MTGWRGPGGGEPTEAGVTDEAEVEQLVDEIEATRGEMTGTVEEIGDRLDPRNVVAGAKETVREATVGKVEQMASSAGEAVGTAGQTAQEAGTGIVDTIRRNPLAAAMAGIGLGWLAMSARSSTGSGGWSQAHRYDRYGGRYGEGGEWTTGTMGREAWGSRPTHESGGVGERVGQMGDTAGRKLTDVQESAGEMVDRFGHRAGEMPDQFQGWMHDVGDNAGRMYHENPVAVGAVALAVGTAIGMALPATPIERNVLSGPAGEAMGKAEEAASQALGKAEQTARHAEQQARQGEQPEGQGEQQRRPH